MRYLHLAVTQLCVACCRLGGYESQKTDGRGNLTWLPVRLGMIPNNKTSRTNSAYLLFAFKDEAANTCTIGGSIIWGAHTPTAVSWLFHLHLSYTRCPLSNYKALGPARLLNVS